MEPEPVEEKPPPIYLRQRSSKNLIETLKILTEKNFSIVPVKKGNIDETKIQVLKITAYKKVTEYLDRVITLTNLKALKDLQL